MIKAVTKHSHFKGYTIVLEFKLQDLWIGVFWKTNDIGLTDIWVCLFPCLPIHIMNYLKH